MLIMVDVMWQWLWAIFTLWHFFYQHFIHLICVCKTISNLSVLFSFIFFFVWRRYEEKFIHSSIICMSRGHIVQVNRVWMKQKHHRNDVEHPKKGQLTHKVSCFVLVCCSVDSSKTVWHARKIPTTKNQNKKKHFQAIMRQLLNRTYLITRL